MSGAKTIARFKRISLCYSRQMKIISVTFATLLFVATNLNAHASDCKTKRPSLVTRLYSAVLNLEDGNGCSQQPSEASNQSDNKYFEGSINDLFFRSEFPEGNVPKSIAPMKLNEEYAPTQKNVRPNVISTPFVLK